MENLKFDVALYIGRSHIDKQPSHVHHLTMMSVMYSYYFGVDKNLLIMIRSEMTADLMSW